MKNVLFTLPNLSDNNLNWFLVCKIHKVAAKERMMSSINIFCQGMSLVEV